MLRRADFGVTNEPMKQCPRCKKIYDDDLLNFCLHDGEMLSNFFQPEPGRYADDSPPTITLNEVRVTNPTNWGSVQQAAPVADWQPGAVGHQAFASGFVQAKDQTLPTISLILGILSLPMMCCYGGIWLGLPAAVLGYLGLRNADSDRARYGGRGLAIGGMVLGIISFLASVLFLVVFIGSR
jgi:hypothetical protein